MNHGAEKIVANYSLVRFHPEFITSFVFLLADPTKVKKKHDNRSEACQQKEK
jgi:hypothetical protein